MKINITNRNKNQVDKEGKPKQPNWQYRFEVAKIGGKRQQISKSGFRTKKEAELAGLKALNEYNQSGEIASAEMSYSDFLDYWMKNYVGMNCKITTIDTYTKLISLHIKPKLGKYMLKSLNPLLLQDYFNELALTLSKGTIKMIYAIVSGSLKYAVIPARLLQFSPAQYLKIPNTAKGAKEKQVLSDADFKDFLNLLSKHPEYVMAAKIAYNTGMRIGEIFALTWNDIDFDKNIINISKTADYSKGKYYILPPKTKTSIRSIYFGNILKNDFIEFRKEQLKNRMQCGSVYLETYIVESVVQTDFKREGEVPVDFLMKRKTGEYIGKNCLEQFLINHKSEFTFHELRHTHATMLTEAGIPSKAIQYRLGHANISTTLQLYTHNTDAMQAQLVETFDRISGIKNA